MTGNKILDRRFYPAGTLIIEEGEKGNCAYYIESGSVDVFTKDLDGRIIHLSEIKAEDIFGEMALITQEKRTASVRTLEDSTLVTISPEDFKLAYSSSDKVFRRLLNVLVQRLAEANDYIVSQHKTIADFEEATHLTIKNVSYSLPDELQNRFQAEVRPVLEHLRVVLKKYKEMTPEKLAQLKEEVDKSSK